MEKTRMADFWRKIIILGDVIPMGWRPWPSQGTQEASQGGWDDGVDPR